MRSLLLTFISFFICTQIYAASLAEIKDVRMWTAPDKTRIVFDISKNVEHRLFTLHKPERLVIDITNASASTALMIASFKNTPLLGFRTAVRNKNDYRVVLDLNTKTKSKSFILKPYKKNGYRLVVDLIQSGTKNRIKTVKSTIASKKLRDVIIAIDAGHGGEDPGAIGSNKTKEKDVVFKIARELAATINSKKGMKAVMIRDGDYYVGLRDRIAKAHDIEADMFISIHADAFKVSSAHGASIYVLSKEGASSEMARLLASNENNSDRIGGVIEENDNSLLRTVLLDLSQTATLRSSIEAGNVILKHFKKSEKIKLHKHKLEHAGFAVLKSPNIPSILIETAFISNPSEERKLRTKKYQKALAKTMSAGIHSYFSQNAPPGSWLASNKHITTKGENLTTIANQYNVTLSNLLKSNQLSLNTILKAGQVLKIPYQTATGSY